MAGRTGLEPVADGPGGNGSNKITWAGVGLSELSRGERRLDGESYLTLGYQIRRAIESSRQFSLLTDLADVWQPNRLKGIQVARDHGQPFLTATQAFDIKPVPRKWLAPGKTPGLARRYVESGWILVTCSGTVGESIVAYKPHRGVILSHDLLRVVPRDSGDYGFLYAFLRSAQARHMMRSSRYGSIVKHLEASHLHDIPVPPAPRQMKAKLDRDIREVYRLRERAFDLESAANLMYEKYFGELSVPSSKDAFVVTAGRSFGKRRRLEARHFNPLAESVIQRLEQKADRVEALGAATKRIFGVPRFKHVYARDGIPYIDSEDLFKVNPELTKFIPEKTKKNPSSYFVDRGWLLMACSGQLYGLNGSVVVAGQSHERKIISNHVLRIVPSEVRVGYLKTALGHPRLGRPAVLRYAFGSEVPEIAPDDLATFGLARLSPALEDGIADQAEEAVELRDQSDALENRCTERVETWLLEQVGVDIDEDAFPEVS